MSRAEATVEELVGMIERGELRLPEMQRRNVWRSPRVRDLIDRLRQQVGRLDVAAEELEGRNQRVPLVKIMFLAFRAAGAKDWKFQMSIALDHSGAQDNPQFHRIFPKAITNGSFDGRDADDIANLCSSAAGPIARSAKKPPLCTSAPMIEKSGSRIRGTVHTDGRDAARRGFLQGLCSASHTDC